MSVDQANGLHYGCTSGAAKLVECKAQRKWPEGAGVFMKLNGKSSFVMLLALAISGCATVEGPSEVVSSGAASHAPADAQYSASLVQKPVLKRKIAIGRFSNSTRYGKALLLDSTKDPIADQASDIMMNDLIRSGKFLVFERPDIDVLAAERGVSASEIRSGLVGVDALVVGSVTELGRKTVGKAGFLSSTKKQIVSASVEIRLVDVKSGLAFFSGAGTGSASTESGEVAGFGSRAGYDATLNDKAISAAIADLMSDIIQRLDERRWSTDILEMQGQNVVISGGQSQGLKVGDRFVVETVGRTVKSRQTGFDIVLPGESVAEIEIVSFFGEDDFSQGSIARIVGGALPAGRKIENLKVVEQ